MSRAFSAKAFLRLTVLLYAISYVTRINYAAVISEVIADRGLDPRAASLALTACALTYGVGQLIAGSLGDRVQPRGMVVLGLVATAFCNILFPFCSSSAAMTAVWAVNGLAQAFLWPPLAKLMAACSADNTAYQRSVSAVMRGAAYGTMGVYLLSPVLIHCWSWRAVFWMAALLATGMAVVWYRCCPLITLTPLSSGIPSASRPRARFPWSVLLAGTLVAITLQGVLRDGITTWTPTYIGATFHLDAELSILTGVVMPIFSALSIAFTDWLARRICTNEMILSAVLFAVAAGASGLIYLLRGAGAIPSVILLALLIGSMHGVNFLLIGIMPKWFSAGGQMATVAGVMNSFTYVGTAVSTYGIAAVSNRFGWDITVALWAATGLLGAVIGMVLARRLTQLKKRNEV